MILLLAMASALVGPDIGAAVSVGEYPSWAIQKSNSGAALVRLLVDPNGRVVRCETLAKRGDDRLANEVCLRTRHRGFAPAHFADGSAAWSQVSTSGHFFPPGGPDVDGIAQLRPEPAAELSVSRLPDDAAVAETRVVVAVDEHGTPTDCVADPRSSAAAQARLAAVVCANRAALGLGPVIDPSGRPIRYVTPLTVRLSVASAR